MSAPQTTLPEIFLFFGLITVGINCHRFPSLLQEITQNRGCPAHLLCLLIRVDLPVPRLRVIIVDFFGLAFGDVPHLFSALGGWGF